MSNHSQRVILENSQSSPIHVTSGVPQGTVLDPVLFLVYINDLPDSICYGTLRLFADDCLLYKTIQSPHDAIDLEQDLLAMQSWEDTWQMKFNISKCFVMRVTQSRKHKVMYDYQLHNFTLNSVDHCKYLGVVLQSNLCWDKHIESITAKANCKMYFHPTAEQMYTIIHFSQKQSISGITYLEKLSSLDLYKLSSNK